MEQPDLDKKSDMQPRSGSKKRFGLSDRGKTFGSLGLKSSSLKPSVLDRFREKTMELKMRKNDESSIMMVTKIDYSHFSPQIWLFVCRLSAFLWCYAYHDF